jgi:hypothetical protein
MEVGSLSVHVYPVNEQHLHDLKHEWCECEPRVEWIDDETGLPYPEGPLVVHALLAEQEVGR